MKLLALSTYPVATPRHGGQRRIAALGELYRRLGASFEVAAVYTPNHANEAGPNDIQLGYSSELWAGLPFVEDIQSGSFAARSPAAYAHFKRVYDRVRPDIVTLEHPFMLPLLQQLISEKIERPKVIYSSHNWEAPLKEAILIRAGVPKAAAAKVARTVEQLEFDALEMADLILAVSDQDANIYRAHRPDKQILVAPNGVEFPTDAYPNYSEQLVHFQDRKFVFFVGSAYPPNIEGFNNLLSEQGLFFVPPRKTFAVCGGVCQPIFASGAYQCFVGANSERVQFFPDVTDGELNALKSAAHVIILPIQFGGGSNLKTAEALVSGKWVVTTSLALRGFEDFSDAEGVIIADSPRAFRHALIDVLQRDPLTLSDAQQQKRLGLVWDNAFRRTGAEDGIRDFFATVQNHGANRLS